MSTIAVVLLCVSSTNGSSPFTGRVLDTWREQKLCGPLALFALLRLHGKEVTLGEVKRHAPVGPHGTSMLQLKRAANRMGLECDIQHASPKTLGKLQVPSIVHYSGVREGHFAVLLAVHNDHVVTADMVSCEMQELSMGEFKRLWSGYVLVKSNKIYKRIILMVIAITIVIACVVFVTRKLIMHFGWGPDRLRIEH